MEEIVNTGHGNQPEIDYFVCVLFHILFLRAFWQPTRIQVNIIFNQWVAAL